MTDLVRPLVTLAISPIVGATRAGAEVMAGLRSLSRVVEHTAAVAVATRVLPDIDSTMQGVAADTTALPQLADSIARVAAATEILSLIEARMAEIEGAMPVLVGVQQHLTRVPEILERLDGRMGQTAVLLERLLTSLEDLSGDVEALGTAVSPLGRLARRVPGRGRSGQQAGA